MNLESLQFGLRLAYFAGCAAKEGKRSIVVFVLPESAVDTRQATARHFRRLGWDVYEGFSAETAERLRVMLSPDLMLCQAGLYAPPANSDQAYVLVW